MNTVSTNKRDNKTDNSNNKKPIYEESRKMVKMNEFSGQE